MKRIFFCLAFSSLGFLFSCSSQVKKEDSPDAIPPSEPAKDTSLQKGIVMPKIKCKSDSSINYALYLPKNYSAENKMPVIFLFDSHGAGIFPIEKYKELAEKYGYILAGSNNSKNGMSWEQNEPQIKIFMNDVKERLNVDVKRIYVCGFSGGSRVASSVAIFEGGINCVIGMGAGFPSLSEAIHNRFDYIGFAGNEDFNINELIALSASMDKSPIRHQLIVFSGKHEWAPAEVAEDAFVWLEVNAMQNGLISKNDTLIKSFISKNEKELKALDEKKKIFDESLLCRKMINYLDGYADVSKFKTKFEELDKSESLKKEIDRKAKLSQEEMVQQENYRNNFVLKDLTWWSAEIKKLNQQAKNKSDEDRSAMNKRLLSYLSLLAYMNCSSDLQQKQFGLLEAHLKIYEMAEPSNSEHQYIYAQLYAIKNDYKKVFFHLEKAMNLGFDDFQRLESDTVFSDLRKSPDYEKLFQKEKIDFQF